MESESDDEGFDMQQLGQEEKMKLVEGLVSTPWTQHTVYPRLGRHGVGVRR